MEEIKRNFTLKEKLGRNFYSMSFIFAKFSCGRAFQRRLFAAHVVLSTIIYVVLLRLNRKQTVRLNEKLSKLLNLNRIETVKHNFCT